MEYNNYKTPSCRPSGNFAWTACRNLSALLLVGQEESIFRKLDLIMKSVIAIFPLYIN